MAFEAKKSMPPPVKRTPKPKAPKAPSPLQETREEAVNGVLQTAAFACVLTGQHADAGALSLHGPKISHELAVVAEDSEPLGNALDYLNKVGPYTTLILAIMPLAFQIAVNHGIGNASAMAGVGVVPPETLKAQIQTEMAQQQAQAIKAQQAADDELRQTMQEWDRVKESATA